MAITKVKLRQGDSWKWRSPRQVSLTVTPNPTTTSSTYDFWWPFPATTIATTPIPLASIPPILISIVANSSVTTSTNTSVDRYQSSATSTTSPSPSSSVSISSSQTPSSITPSPAVISTSPFTILDLIPALAAVGIFVLGLGLWLLYGCCTRRPRVRADDKELICGPPYVSDDADNLRCDIGRGQRDQEEIPQLPEFRHRGISAQYRWPSYNQPPVFDPAKGFYLPNEYMEEDDDKYIPATFVTPEANEGRTKSLRTQPSSKSRESTGPSGSRPVSPLCSDSTSVALLELYESDEEEEAKRKATELPWESLRHKSIKRGILEQVKKDNKWMDSIRSSIVGSSGFLASLGSTKVKERGEVFPGAESGVGTSQAQHRVGKRRGHVRADSDLVINLARSTSTNTPSLGPSGQVVADTMPLKVSKRKTAISGVRRGYTRLRDQDIKFKATPPHTYVTESQSDYSRTQRSSPVKSGSNTTPAGLIADAIPISRDILPTSPSQIMSPPLESQMCFTPIPAFNAQIPASSQPRSKARASTDAHGTKTPSPQKARNLHCRSPPPVSLPGHEGVTSPHAEAYRGGLTKKSYDVFGPPKLPAHPLRTHDGYQSRPSHSFAPDERASDGKAALRKVDQILKSSRSARELQKVS